MTTTAPPTTHHTVRPQHDDHPTIPLRRVLRVELRKMFDTRTGFWLMASLVIVGHKVYVTNLALGLTPAVGDEIEEEVNIFTVVKVEGIPGI